MGCLGTCGFQVRNTLHSVGKVHAIKSITQFNRVQPCCIPCSLSFSSPKKSKSRRWISMQSGILPLGDEVHVPVVVDEDPSSTGKQVASADDKDVSLPGLLGTEDPSLTNRGELRLGLLPLLERSSKAHICAQSSVSIRLFRARPAVGCGNILWLTGTTQGRTRSRRGGSRPVHAVCYALHLYDPLTGGHRANDMMVVVAARRVGGEGLLIGQNCHSPLR